MSGLIQRRLVVVIVTASCLLYAAARFYVSGVTYPLSQPNLGQVMEEAEPLIHHIASGEPAVITNPRQYGPTFFFVLDPILRITGNEPVAMGRWLFAVQIVALAVAFGFTCLSLRMLAPGYTHWGLLSAWLAVIWLTFAPLYAILAVKNVETWELALLAVALYCVLKGRLWIAAFAVALAGLTKLIPLIFIYLLLLRNRPAFWRSLAAIAVVLSVAHAVYGPQMGLWYLPQVGGASVGESWAGDWHENISAKAAIAKFLGHLENPADAPAASSAFGAVGYRIVLSETRARVAVVAAQIVQVLLALWLTWICLRQTQLRGAARTHWEWAMVASAMLIVSPVTAFEYTVLTLSALSHVLVRVAADARRADSVTIVCFAGALLLLGAFFPRSLLNRLSFVDAINRWTGYTHLTPSEAYQYYCFPLLGLILLVLALWRLNPPGEPPQVAV